MSPGRANGLIRGSWRPCSASVPGISNLSDGLAAAGGGNQGRLKVLSAIRCTYGNPGYNSVSIKVLDASGQVIYTASQTIFVASVSDRDLMLRSVYLGMLGRLQVSDIPNALNALTSGVYDKYRAVFSTLSNLTSVVPQLGTIQEGAIGDDLAEFLIQQNTGSGSAGFLIYLMLGDDGIWRIDSM